MAESVYKLHVINSIGERIDIPLFDTKEEALYKDDGSGKVLALYHKGKPLYAPTNDKAEEPDVAQLHFIDGDGNLRHVHQSVGVMTLVPYASYTGNFETLVSFPYGGQIIVNASNGAGGGNSSDGGDGGAGGVGWKIFIGDNQELEFTAPSGGGGGGRGGNNYSGSTYSSGGSAGSGAAGSRLTINFTKGELLIKGITGQNGGGGRGGGSPRSGGAGGASWPYTRSGVSTHKGGDGGSGRTGYYRDSYGTKYYYGGSGGAGGLGYPNNVLYEYEGVAATNKFDGVIFASSLIDVSQGTYSAQILRWEYI